MKKNKIAYRIILTIFVAFQFAYIGLAHPKPIGSALLSASVTMGNSRLSYKAQIAGTPSSGATSVNIETSGHSDNDTDHLFPKDTICFSNASADGCYGSTTHTVTSITDSDTFAFTAGLSNTLLDTDLVIASQSGSMVIAFTTQTEIPVDGDILLTIPAVNANTLPCDGIPDHSTATSSNGFDLGDANHRVAAGDISVSSSGCANNWNATETITCGTSSTDHTIRIDRATNACAAGSTLTITIDSNPGIINPAPVTSGHTQGVADTYSINATTRNGSDVALDSVDMLIAPIEAVLVTATVDETLSFTVTGQNTGATTCGVNPDVTTTATSVPYGTIAAVNTMYDAAHDLEVSTNADDGYAVTATHTDQLGKDGGVCTGDAGVSSDCIPDTTCNSSCSHTSADDWTVATNNGFGYSLDSTDGTDAEFEYDSTTTDGCTVGTYCARQFADEETGSEAAVDVMSNTGPVSSKNIYVCYRLSIGGTQPAGYYQTKVRYTATPVF